MLFKLFLALLRARAFVDAKRKYIPLEGALAQ